MWLVQVNTFVESSESGCQLGSDGGFLCEQPFKHPTLRTLGTAGPIGPVDPWSVDLLLKLDCFETYALNPRQASKLQNPKARTARRKVLRVALSRHPNLSRKPPKTLGKQRSVFEKRTMVEKNGQGITP